MERDEGKERERSRRRGGEGKTRSSLCLLQRETTGARDTNSGRDPTQCQLEAALSLSFSKRGTRYRRPISDRSSTRCGGQIDPEVGGTGEGQRRSENVTQEHLPDKRERSL